MKKCALLLMLASLPALAQDKSDVRPQTIDGKSFVCFLELDARDLLDMRLKYPVLKEQVLVLEEKVSLKQQQIDLLVAASKIQEEQIDLSTKKMAQLEETLDSMNAWYKSPVLWVVVGFVVGGVVVGVATYYIMD